MSDRKIKNISNLANALPVQVKNTDGGKDVLVYLNSNEEFWCPNALNTNSLAVYSRKGFIILAEEQKPAGANYYEAYPSGYWNVVKEEPEKETATEESVGATAPQRIKWEEEDIAFLKKHYPKKGVAYCAEKLDRPKHSVKKKVEALGLKKEDDKE